MRQSVMICGAEVGIALPDAVLRSQLPAEQLLVWMDTLLRDDIPNRFRRIIVRYEKDQPVWFPVDHFPDAPAEFEEVLITRRLRARRVRKSRLRKSMAFWVRCQQV